MVKEDLALLNHRDVFRENVRILHAVLQVHQVLTQKGVKGRKNGRN